jgi:hypothetical protein
MILNAGAAVNVIYGIRTHRAQSTGCPTWDEAGIRAALTACEGTPGSVLAAAALAAEDTNLRAPSVAAFRHHWPVNASSTPPRQSLTQRCPEHPEHDMPHDHAGDMTPEQIAAEAARIRALITPGPKPRNPAPPAPVRDLDATRAAIDTKETS